MDTSWINATTRYQTALRAGDDPHGTNYFRGYRLRRFARSSTNLSAHAERDDVIAFLGTEGWAASYRRSCRVPLRAFLRSARDEHVLSCNPMKGIRWASAHTPACADATLRRHHPDLYTAAELAA